MTWGWKATEAGRVGPQLSLFLALGLWTELPLYLSFLNLSDKVPNPFLSCHGRVPIRSVSVRCVAQGALWQSTFKRESTQRQGSGNVTAGGARGGGHQDSERVAWEVGS
jgi:hypothetical protein